MLFVLKNMFQSLRARFASPVDLRPQLQGGHLPIRQGGPFGVAAGSSEGSAVPAPPRDLVAPAREDRLMAEGEVPRVSARVQALRDEAVSKKHQLFDFPKNPFCDTRNGAKLHARRVRHKPRPDHEPDEHCIMFWGRDCGRSHSCVSFS